jgi:hypothetical protein
MEERSPDEPMWMVVIYPDVSAMFGLLIFLPMFHKGILQMSEISLLEPQLIAAVRDNTDIQPHVAFF